MLYDRLLCTQDWRHPQIYTEVPKESEGKDWRGSMRELWLGQMF